MRSREKPLIGTLFPLSSNDSQFTDIQGLSIYGLHSAKFPLMKRFTRFFVQNPCRCPRWVIHNSPAFLGLCFTRVRPVGFNDEPGEPLVRQYHPQPLECSAETVARQDQELDVNEGPSQFGEQPGLAHAE